MNLPGQATLHSSVVKAWQPAVATGALCRRGACSWRFPRAAARAARGLDVLAQGCGHGVLVQGAREHFLGDEGFLDSSFLVARVLDAVDLVQGPRALEPGRLLGEEGAEAPPGLHHPRRMEGEAAREMVKESPLRR